MWRILLLFPALLPAAEISPALLTSLEWRSLGPASMGGRISDIAGVPGDPRLVYAAAGSGGVFKSTDAGMTWKSLFDQVAWEHRTTLSIGALAMDGSRPQIVWVGTGESNVRNSVSFGNGVYKSTDGGEHWIHCGLEATETISRIVVHPTDPEIAWVAALGHPFGPNPERGVFRTDDGGKTWRKTLFLDDLHGAADLEIDPSNPEILYAAMWHFDRKPWMFESGSEKGGVFQSTDGGKSWRQLTGGLPKLAGRIGIKVAPSHPETVYVIAESNDGVLFRSDDRGATFRRINDDKELVSRGYYYADLRVDPKNPERVFVLTNGLMLSADGGKTFRRISSKTHGDLHALWIDPQNPSRIWQGQDGGMAVSWDGGEHWDHVENLPLGQFYQVYADSRQPFYRITGGTQDNGTWTGPSRTREPAGILNDDWRMVNAIVGFAALSHPDDPDVILTEQPGGVLLKTDLRTREQQVVSPQPRSYSGAPASEMRYRFNWNAPLVRSPHGKSTIYFAGNVIWQSADFGKSWEAISKDLTNHDPSKLGNSGGPVWIDNSAGEVYATITRLAESPARQGVLWAGTDDGNVQVTRNGGGKWENVAANIPGLAPASPVAFLEASRTSAEAAYAAFDRHLFDDFRPYLYKTTDGGRTWTPIAGDLPPTAYLWCVREDPANPRLLFAGTEIGLFASFTGGGHWIPLKLRNLPPAAVRDIQFSADGDLLVATHGRGLFVLDDLAPLEQLAPETLAEGAALFPVRNAWRYTQRATRYGSGDRAFAAPNPPYGAHLTYWVQPGTTAKIEILDAKNTVVRTLDLPAAGGLGRVTWDLRVAPGPQALPGAYRARIAGSAAEREFAIRLDPEVHATAEELAVQFDLAMRLRRMRGELTALLKQVETAGRPGAEALADKARRPANLRRSETGPRILENIDDLYAKVDGVNAAPTAAMGAYFSEIEAQWQEWRADARKFLGRE